MTLATIEADIREGVESAVDWLKRTTDEHLPALRAELEKAAASPAVHVFVQAAEAAFLTPAEVAWVTELIGKIPALRSQPAPDPGEASPGDSPAAA